MIPLPLDIPSPPRGVWELGPIPIRAYALFIIIGIIVAGYWGNRRLIARGGRPGAIIDMAVWMVPFGLVGGRLYHLITDPELYFCSDGCNPWNAFAIWNGGLGIWGAIALGAVGAYIAARRYRIPFGSIADALAPGIVLAQGIGRLGNYFNQELFGSPTTVPWALDVYLRTPGGAPGSAAQIAACQAPGASPEFPTEWIKATPEVLCGTYHPTFLYELLWNIGVVLLVVWADRRFRLGHGRAFAVYVAGYTAGRGWIEMLRIDHANHILGLRINVFVSVAVFLAAVIYLIATRGRGREEPQTVWGITPGGASGARGAGRDGHAPERDDADGDAPERDDADGGDADGGDPGGDEAADPPVSADGSPDAQHEKIVAAGAADESLSVTDRADTTITVARKGDGERPEPGGSPDPGPPASADEDGRADGR